MSTVNRPEPSPLSRPFPLDDDEAPNDLSLAFVERLFAEYTLDPQSIDADWRRYFAERYPLAPGDEARLGPSFVPSGYFARAPRRTPAISAPEPATDRALGSAPGLAPVRLTDAQVPPPSPKASAAAPLEAQSDAALWQDRLDQLVRAFRVRGHMSAQLDPLGLPRPEPPELQPASYGFSDADLERRFSTETIHGADTMTLGGIVERLRNTYCRSIGVEFMHIDDPEVIGWLLDRMESSQNRLALSRREQVRILTKLTDAAVFEEFLRKRFLGAKSFSLEGAESLIPLLDLAIEGAGEFEIDEIVLAMAHRGRLNVLANIMGKRPQDIFREFEDLDPESQIGRGDVKYHLGHSVDWFTDRGRRVHISLCFNPSHLEFVNPVALGRLRAKQDHAGDLERRRGMALLIHGDAAFAGEGVSQETLNLSELAGYTTGGAIHVVVNNQLGFTTPPGEGRSTPYATDVAKMSRIPIFHVNGEDPEAVAQVVRLALEFRHQFQRDVVIDMYCYRRRGHNEGDEPAFTQPVLYQAIERRKSVREGYVERLLTLDGISREEVEHIAADRRRRLENGLSLARSQDYAPETPGAGAWSGYFGGMEALAPEVPTGWPLEKLATALADLTRLPEDFSPHPTIARNLGVRREMAQGNRPLDWAAAEALAYGTLAVDGFRVRLTGQDSARGTFSHRHAVLHDSKNGREYMPLAHLSERQAAIEIRNSPLSEIAVLGYEYGYSLDCPDGLTLWEAQFGDFCNVAQVIIDQFIASGEDKWRRLSGLTLLLPHGFEGQGPEHSSARLERFLSLAAKDNMQIVNLTTPAQLFHLLRRQALRKWRKPLVIMTPKSLLRHPEAVSSLAELAEGTFQRVIPDRRQGPIGATEKVLLCSGKIYYELEKRRAELGRDDVAILRVEQLYPIPREELREALAPYADETPVVWTQEEPENMGAWRFWLVKFGARLFERHAFRGVFRPGAPSPATGSHNCHALEQQNLIDNAFGIG